MGLQTGSGNAENVEREMCSQKHRYVFGKGEWKNGGKFRTNDPEKQPQTQRLMIRLEEEEEDEEEEKEKEVVRQKEIGGRAKGKQRKKNKQ